MFYFSTIINNRVHDKNDEFIGNLIDILIESGQKNHPPVVGILVREKKSKKVSFIPSKNVSSWSSDAVILNVNENQIAGEMPQKHEFLLLRQHIIDRQIVDLTGAKVVRVNDLQFGLLQGQMCLLAIDVSSSGLIRRLGFKEPVFHLFKPHLMEWKEVQLIGDKLQLAIGKDQLVKMHPADIANVIEKLNLRQGSLLLKSLDEVTAAKVLEEIQPEIQKMLVQHLGVDRSANIMSKMSTDELVDLIQLLPGREAKRLIDGLPFNKDINSVKKILEYEEDEAGGLMSTEYVTAGPESTVSEVIEKIRQHSHMHRSIQFIYVVDSNNRFQGVVSMRRLLINPSDEIMKNLMKRISHVPPIRVETRLTEIASIMTKYNLLSVSVVDKDNKLLGVITVDDIMRCLVPKA